INHYYIYVGFGFLVARARYNMLGTPTCRDRVETHMTLKFIDLETQKIKFFRFIILVPNVRDESVREMLG
ncbi:hypothetical protein ACJX0J_007918, partial [Zea mays]